MNASFLETAGHFISRGDWLDPLGWALVDSTWQFALIAVVLGLTLRLLNRAASRARYAVCVVGLLGIVVLPAATWLRVSSRVVSGGAVATPGLDEVRRVRSQSGAPLEVAIADSDDRDAFARAGTTSQLGEPASLHEPAVVGRRREYAAWGLTLKPWLPTLVSAWLIGVAFFALRPLWSWRTVRRLRRVATSPLPDSLSRLFDNAAAKVGLRRPVRVLQSGLLSIPAVVGYFRPVVLVPISVAACFPPNQLEALFVHELAHIRRHDYLVNLFQAAIETLFFYHPAVWWISSQIRRERENCCDDLVLSVCKGRKEYAQALIALEELRASFPLTAVAASGGLLLTRIHRILGVKADPRPGLGLIVPAAIALALLVAAGVTSPSAKPATAASSSVHLAAASQAKSADSSPPAIRVELPDGGFVDFLGVCEYPCRDHAWWQLDGSPLAKTPDALPSDHGNGWFPNSMLREFAFDTSTLDGPAAFHAHLGGRLDYSSSDSVSSEDVPGRQLRKHRLIKVFPANAQTDTIAFTYNGGPWTPFLSRGAKADVTLALPVEFDAAGSEAEAIRRMKDRVWLTVADRKRGNAPKSDHTDGKHRGPKLESIDVRIAGSLPPGDRQFRLVAVDRDNREHPTLMYVASRREFALYFGPWQELAETRFQTRAICWDVPKDRIKEFRFETRPNRSHRIEFGEISLQRGQRTTCKVFIDGRPYVPKTADRSSRSSLETNETVATLPVEPTAIATRAGEALAKPDVATGSVKEAEPLRRFTDIQRSRFGVVLPDGTAIALLSVASGPREGHKTWQADGSSGTLEAINDTLCDEAKAFFFPPADSPIRSLRVDASTKGEGTVSVATKGYTSHSQRRHVVDKSVYEQHCLVAATSAKSTTSVFVKYFSKPWRTVAKRSATFGDGGIDRIDFAEGNATFTRPATKDGGTQLVVTYEVKDRDSRIVAVDQQDRECPPETTSGDGRNRMVQADFQRLSPSQIREFRFQIRDYRMVEFRNVSLQPGNMTSVEIYLDGKRVPTEAAKLE